MDKARVLAALSALANDKRLDLVRALVVAGDAGLPAGEIARLLDVSASRLSFHLAALEQAGLITSRRVARNVIYAADHAGIGRVIAYLLDDCCAGHPKVQDCCRRRAASPADTAPA